MRNYFVSILTFVPFCFVLSLSAAANDRIKGEQIKEQVRIATQNLGLNFELLVSDKRAFFACSEQLDFEPLDGGDWTTVKVICSKENWSTILRTTFNPNIGHEADDEVQENVFQAVIASKNLIKGELITEDHLKLTKISSANISGSFKDVVDIVGRKATFNISRGAIIKPRHLELIYDVEKGQTVMLMAENASISIATNAIALETGQRGDMIKVRNTNSGKVLSVIVQGEKKVSPLTNM
jgi:flagella basal body P-ring formation protein FlgA